MQTAITAKLEALGVPYTSKPHSMPVYTSEDAARERGIRLSQVVKTMVLSTRRGDMVVAVLPGDRRLDLKRLKKHLGVKDLRFVDREAVKEKLGLVAGAIAPIADLFRGLPMYVDPAVFREARVDISSGDPRCGLELSSEDLGALLHGATVIPITQR